jgi:glycosyltransferase involved in cell wall biosynthesis
MLSAIIPTRESERSLVPTLNALFPAVMTGLLAEVIVADAGSRDATREVADIAGCQFLSSDAPLGTRLKEAVAASRGAWLLFLPAGSILDANWVDTVQAFIAPANLDRAASFRANAPGLLGALRASLGGRNPQHGLLIGRRTYDALGGHAAGDDADAAFLHKLGRRIATLPASITVRRDT